MRAKELLTRQSVTDIFTAVFVFVDDCLQAAEAQGRFTLPKKCNQKASYSELMTIVLVGEILQQANQGAWYLLVKNSYQELFPVLPELTRFYRIQRNFERIYADLAMLIAQHDGVYAIDSKPLPICQGSRTKRHRKMSQATSGKGSAAGYFYGYKLHAITTGKKYICRFAIVPANEHDSTVARCLLNERYDDLHSIVGDKAYQGVGIYTPPKNNATEHSFWSGFFAKARKVIESVFSSLTRSRHLVLQQLNSFWSIRASVCRKIAAHNLMLFLFS